VGNNRWNIKIFVVVIGAWSVHNISHVECSAGPLENADDIMIKKYFNFLDFVVFLEQIKKKKSINFFPKTLFLYSYGAGN
jgi:hypothetical protein